LGCLDYLSHYPFLKVNPYILLLNIVETALSNKKFKG